MAKLKLISEKKLYANFMNENIQLGNIYSLDEKEFALLDNIGSYSGIDLNADKYSSVSNKQDMLSTTTSNSSIVFKGEANVQLAKGECGIQFSKTKSSFFSLKGAVTKTLKLGQVKKQYMEYLKENNYQNSRKWIVIVNVVVEAASGVLIYCESRDTKIELKANNNQPLTTSGIVAKGNLDIVVGKNKVVSIAQPNIFQPLFNAMWWRPKKEEWDEL